MKVKFRQSGGFAGLIKGCEYDTGSLEPGEAKELESLVEQFDLLAAKSRQASEARDTFQYELTIENDGEMHHLAFDEMTTPKEAEPLLEYLQRRAKPRPLT